MTWRSMRPWTSSAWDPCTPPPRRRGARPPGSRYVTYAAERGGGPAVVRDRRDRPGYCGRGDGGGRRSDRGGEGDPRRRGPRRGRSRAARPARVRGPRMTKRSTPRKRRAPRSRAHPRRRGRRLAERGYSRSQRRNEEARAALEPLAEGERPGAVTVGAVAAGVLAVANLVALIVGYDPGEGRKTASSLLGTAILLVVAVGMWNVRYWAVLGMQALLAVTMLLVVLALAHGREPAGRDPLLRDPGLRGRPVLEAGEGHGPHPDAGAPGRRAAPSLSRLPCAAAGAGLATALVGRGRSSRRPSERAEAGRRRRPSAAGRRSRRGRRRCTSWPTCTSTRARCRRACAPAPRACRARSARAAIPAGIVCQRSCQSARTRPGACPLAAGHVTSVSHTFLRRWRWAPQHLRGEAHAADHVLRVAREEVDPHGVERARGRRPCRSSSRYFQGKLARPAVTTVAPGSARLMARVGGAAGAACSPSDQIEPPSTYQYFTRWGSFQICQWRIGTFGSSGCSAQKVPLRPVAAHELREVRRVVGGAPWAASPGCPGTRPPSRGCRSPPAGGRCGGRRPARPCGRSR